MPRQLISAHFHFLFFVSLSSVSDEFKKWLLLGRKRDPEAWEMYPSMVNAYFNPPANEVCIKRRLLRMT